MPFQCIYQVLLALKSTKYTLNPTTTTLIKASTVFPGNFSNSILPSLPVSIFTFLLSVFNIDYKYLTLKNLMFEKNPNSFLWPTSVYVTWPSAPALRLTALPCLAHCSSASAVPLSVSEHTRFSVTVWFFLRGTILEQVTPWLPPLFLQVSIQISPL